MPIRRAALLDRTKEVRDARLFVIATEGQETEKQYFEGLRSSRVHVEVLPTGTDGSGPDAVLARLAEFKERYDIGPDDELWLVVDVDRWGDLKLRDVCRASQNRFQTAISNPCFEFWLYLHFSESDLTDPEWAALLDAKKGAVSKAMEARLRERLQALGGYSKTNLQPERFYPHIPVAIKRARVLDTNPGERWPATFPGTHVYRLVEKLRQFLPPDATV